MSIAALGASGSVRLGDAAPWLATMRELAGVKEYAGGENNPTILGWARFK